MVYAIQFSPTDHLRYVQSNFSYRVISAFDRNFWERLEMGTVLKDN